MPIYNYLKMFVFLPPLDWGWIRVMFTKLNNNTINDQFMGRGAPGQPAFLNHIGRDGKKPTCGRLGIAAGRTISSKFRRA